MKLTESNTLLAVVFTALLSDIIWPVTHWSVYLIGECICYIFFAVHIVYVLKQPKAWALLIGIYAILFVINISHLAVVIDSVLWFLGFIYFYKKIKTYNGLKFSFFMCWISFFNVLRNFGIGNMHAWSPGVIVSALLLYIYTTVKFNKQKLI